MDCPKGALPADDESVHARISPGIFVEKFRNPVPLGLRMNYVHTQALILHEPYCIPYPICYNIGIHIVRNLTALGGVFVLTNLKKYFGAQDMTTGKPMTNIARFAIPLLIGNIAQQLYSTVDSIVVGRYCSVEVNGYNGVDALSAIGAAMPLVFLLLIVFMSIGTGAGVLVAQYFGARDKKGLERCVGTSVTLTFITSVIITLIGVPLSGPLLRLVRTPEAYYEISRVYLQITFLGIIGGGFYNIISGILRGLGDSVYPLLLLITAALLNVAPDLWFVIGFGWGVAGDALPRSSPRRFRNSLHIRLMHMKDVSSSAKRA